jgi:RNA polymerase sigma factor (sigma-70 family)
MSNARPPDDAPSDDDLVARTRAGDGAAFEKLHERYADRLAAWLSNFAGRRELEDLVQDTFLKAYGRLDQYAPGNFGAWLFRIARNAAIDWGRRRQPEALSDPDQQVIGREMGPSEMAMHHERDLRENLQLQRCLAELDARARELIKGLLGGETFQAVCTRLRIAVKRGYRIKFKAMRQLQRCVKRRGP